MGTIVRSPNRAGETAVQEQVARELVPLIRRTREDRQTWSATCMRFWNLWSVRHDSASYQGRRRAYLATGRRVIENWVAMLKRSAFPITGKWFATTARTVESEDRATTVQALFQRYVAEYMAVRRKSAPILRGVVILGTQPLDMGWRVSAREVPTYEEIAAEGGNGRSMSRLDETVKRVVTYLGPTLRPVDFFRWYVWPTTINDLDDADLCFEDFLQDPRELERLTTVPIIPGREKGKDGLGYHIDPSMWTKAKELIPRGERADSVFQDQQRRLQARGFRSPMQRADDPAYVLDCVKGYWKAQLKGDDEPTWYEIILAGDDIPLRIRQISQGLIGAPSYFTPKFVEVWEEFYGYGLPTAFDSLQYFANDILNQGGDALTWSLNPIAAIDPDAIQDHTTLQMKPGAKWLIRMPRASVAWMEPPKESGIVALQATSQLVGLINDVGGVQPFAPGGKTTGKGRSVETLGGLQILASEGQIQAADVTQGLEDLWLNPMLRRMYDLTIQCLDEPILLNVEGVQGAALIQEKVSRAKLIGEFEFKWLASTYQYNAEVRSQQMSGFLQILSRIPPEVLAADNTRVRIGEYLRIMYTDALQLPNPEKVFQDTTPVRAVAPDLENELYRQGHGEDVTVSPADRDDQHIQLHTVLLMDQTVPPEIQQLVMAHVQQHMVAKVAKELMQAQQAAGGGPGMVMGGGPGGPPAPGAMPGGRPTGGNGQDRLALPDAPGRIGGTASIDDVVRRMPRPGGNGIM